MENECTIGDIYETIAERLATARTKALMGERQEALGIFQGAALDWTRFRDVLTGYPGYHALEHAFNVTMTALSAEQEMLVQEEAAAVRASRTRKKTRRAA